MTDNDDREQRLKWVEQLFGAKPKPEDPDIDAGKHNPELRKFTRDIFNRA